ncbi:tRNA lysidine(34) synthetase TilS [Salinisphaera hydrothermalis]|uniref:tRNA(Ile)-lysidine synthase n=1 Tax=Salinisphaera hydrothermalis (strain C41B8) TaxID=1304275 RepID=A0A084IK00_SALHC|nr:tRNA lysidine(34) synthetase TilS [Salinisphaera hydrothermalis]KEZ77034.1 cell cycle protein [Salinisphaera hydrothermalis C41B8]
MSEPDRLIAALEHYPSEARALVVAFSGGRDSSVLLHALSRAELSVGLRAIHIGHGLEPDAATWADHCRRFCETRHIDFACREVTVDTRDGGLEAAARAARYAALRASLGPGEVLVTAHHAEDQAETFLLQALRGTGVSGLAAMPRLMAFGAGQHWRPWLDVPRAAITAYAEVYGLDWVEDATNRDSQRARGYLRERLWPTLIDRWPAAAETLSRSAAWAGQAAEAVATLARIDCDAAADGEGRLRIDALAELSTARQSETLRLWLAECGRDRPDHRHLAQIRRLLTAREHAGPRVSFASTEVRRFDGRLFAMPRLPSPPAIAQRVDWPPGSTAIDLPAGCGRLTFRSKEPRRHPADLHVVFNRPGAELTRADGRAVPLAEWLRQQRVPPWIRERLPRIQAGDTLLALPRLWRHPHIERWFGHDVPDFLWYHDLPGAGSG